MANVKFFQVDVKSKFNALLTKDPLALYWIEETKELYKGASLFGTGSIASEKAAGLLSAEDYAELQRLIAAGANLVPIATIDIAGKVKASEEIAVAEDGAMSLVAVPLMKVTGLDERLSSIEQAAKGGVHYKGSVETLEDLPVDAEQGDLYEVLADGSEWCFNGEKWFEYGGTKILYNKDQFSVVDGTLNLVAVDAKIVDYNGKKLNAVLDSLPDVYVAREYEITSAPAGTLVDYRDHEIRVMCPEDTAWVLQESGEGSDPNSYYIGFKAYVPSDDVVSFKEDLATTIGDNTMYYFENNPTAGVDKHGRKYSIVWLPVANYDADTDTWTYYGTNSSDGKYIGWYYTVEFYNADGKVIDTDTIRINLTNADCHRYDKPYYMDKYATVEDVSEAMSWGEI